MSNPHSLQEVRQLFLKGTGCSGGDGQQPSSPAGRAFHAKSPTCHTQKDANPCEGGFGNTEQSYTRVCSLASKSTNTDLPKGCAGKATKKTYAYGYSLQETGPKCHQQERSAAMTRNEDAACKFLRVYLHDTINTDHGLYGCVLIPRGIKIF